MKLFKKLGCGAFVSLAAVGCNGSPTIEMVPASGTVLLDQKPVPGVALTLVPQEGVKGRGGYATSAADGSFALQAEPNAIGVAPGKYRVLFQKFAMPDGSAVPPGTSSADADLINQLPALYGHPERSPVFAVIPAVDGQGLSFQLNSRVR